MNKETIEQFLTQMLNEKSVSTEPRYSLEDIQHFLACFCSLACTGDVSGFVSYMFKNQVDLSVCMTILESFEIFKETVLGHETN